MKRKAISIAVLAACGTSGGAMAFDPDDVTPLYEMRISGATAPTATLRDVIIDNLCDGGSAIDYWLGRSKHWQIACVVGGNNVLFRKNDGGSGTGTSPVDNASTSVEFFVGGYTSTVGGCSVNMAAQMSPGGKSWTLNKDCGDATNNELIISDIGISDIEPTAFKGPLAPVTDRTQPLTTRVPFVNESNMIIESLAGLAFGVVVTTDMYQALQNDQFPATHPLFDDCNPGGANYNDAETDSSDTTPPGTHTTGVTERCMPNMASHTVRQFHTDPSFVSWTRLATGADGSSNLFADSAGQAWAPTNLANPGLAKGCYRVQGSGTHARTAIFFSKTGCGAGGQTMRTPVCITNDTGAGCLLAPVEGGTGSGQMTDCLINAAENVAGSVWALGYHSLEKNSELDHPFRFVKIDGFAPTTFNMISGNYANFGEVTMQRRGDGSAFVGAPANSAEVISHFDTIVAAMQGPAAAEALNNSDKFRHPFGDAGWAARPVGGNTPYPIVADADGFIEDPVNALTHFDFTSNTQNTCFGPVAPAGNLVD